MGNGSSNYLVRIRLEESRYFMQYLYDLTSDPYWQKVAIVHWLIGKIPTEKNFRQWIASNHWPYKRFALKAIRQQWQINDYADSDKIRFNGSADLLDYPFTCEIKLTTGQRLWVSRNITSVVEGIGTDDVGGIYYRGIQRRNDTILSSKLPSWTFCSKEVAMTYAGDTGIVYRARIEAYNPFINSPRDAFIDYDTVVNRLGEIHAQACFQYHAEWVMATDAWADIEKEFGDRFQPKDDDYLTPVHKMTHLQPELLPRLCIQIYVLLDGPLFISILKQRGYDCAIYRGSGESLDTHEFRVWDRELITVMDD